MTDESLADKKRRLLEQAGKIESGFSETAVKALAIQELPLDSLEVSKYQPRRFFSQKPLQQLADSISDHGVMQPIIVRPVENGRYEIIAGERRWRASQLAEKSSIPAIVQDFSDKEAARLSLIENIQREGLDPIEEAMAIERLMDEFEMNQKSAARALGKSSSYITRMLNLIKYTSEETRSRIESSELKPSSPEVLAEIKENKRKDPEASKAGRLPQDDTSRVKVPRELLFDIGEILAKIQDYKPINKTARDGDLIVSLKSLVEKYKAKENQ